MSDIQLISHIPNMTYLCPSSREEYFDMFYYSTRISNSPVAIRVPSTELISTGIEDKTDYSVLNKYKVEKTGEKIAILGLGNFFELAKEVQSEIEENKIGDEDPNDSFGKIALLNENNINNRYFKRRNW